MQLSVCSSVLLNPDPLTDPVSAGEGRRRGEEAQVLMAQRQAAGRYGLISSPMVPRFSRSMPCPYRLTHHCHRHPLYAHGGGSALDWQLEWHGVAKARVSGRGAGTFSAAPLRHVFACVLASLLLFSRMPTCSILSRLQLTFMSTCQVAHHHPSHCYFPFSPPKSAITSPSMAKFKQHPAQVFPLSCSAAILL